MLLHEFLGDIRSLVRKIILTRAIVIWSIIKGSGAVSFGQLSSDRTCKPMFFSELSPTADRLCHRILLTLALCLLIAGCDSDLQTDTTLDNDDQTGTPTSVPPTGSAGVASNEKLSLRSLWARL